MSCESQPVIESKTNCTLSRLMNSKMAVRLKIGLQLRISYPKVVTGNGYLEEEL